MGERADALARRLLQGARALRDYVEELDDVAWATPVIGDGRSVGVIVHHVAYVYPIEVELAEVLARGEPIVDLTWEEIREHNAEHAAEYAGVSKAESLALLEKNAEAAAAGVRRFTDTQLDAAAPVSINAHAPLTAQFFLEDHALSHSFHHLERIRRTLEAGA